MFLTPPLLNRPTNVSKKARSMQKKISGSFFFLIQRFLAVTPPPAPIDDVFYERHLTIMAKVPA